MDNANGETSAVVNDTIENSNKVKKKKRKNRDDVYDHEDWFVDDSEDAVVLKVEAKRYETKHSGFFVSEGSLDVASARSIAASKPVKKPAATFEAIKESSAVTSKVSYSKPKAQVSSQATNGGGVVAQSNTSPLNKPHTITTSPARNVPIGLNEKQPGGAEEKQKRTRTVIPKPEYVATDSVKGGIAIVKEEVKRLRAMNDNKKFHFIPDTLDEYLLLLDDLVRQHNPEIYNNTHIGYFEEISQAILDTQKPKVMKAYFTCIRSHRDANKCLQEYTRLIDELVLEAKNNIVPFVAPSNTESANDGTELTASESQVDVPADAAKSKSKVDYKWTCAWKPVMRSLLAAIDKNVQLYVHHSSVCRSNMSNHEREKLPSDESANIDGKVYVTNILKAIVSRGFPEACKNGDVTYLRTIISQEKNKESKKSGHKSPSHSPVKMSTVATEGDSKKNVKRKPEETKASEPHKKAMKIDEKTSVKEAAITNGPLKGTYFRQIEFNMDDFTCID
jgi:hypothetical protein